ncbi:MAG: adenosylmethionine decarboxylase [Candidatus Niyogibacteria bacterium CG10_big_fil_rev_8_21_14_0_10_42_19]|uniref:Adenosylmethionine decarboxylase n=1 Tax=Candidatus Niyogibacteria bacterium CG10_big_fil_rev_8_21_14_0_10_42_19 TaxID=1974725 RepID=A0A2H0TFZ0_9BACT|nr:MAG: adenosylmethionine decarboxylase [Candidatus Niyogibacteria bacterium CG10_big_fil_rev_8_21_14_0_10_42_19]
MVKITKKELKQPHFGLHLTFDAYHCDERILNSHKATEKFLNEAVKKLEMHKLVEPKVVHAKANNFKDPGGYTGFVIIQESHISVHTFPKRKFVSIDLYSCKDFDYEKAISFTKKYFKSQAIETNVIIRGKKYPLKNIVK